MIDAAIVLLWLADRLPLAAFAIILVRDVILVGGSRFATRRGYVFDVSILGKAATWVLYLSLFCLLATTEGTRWPLWLFWLGIGMAGAAGVQYVARVVRRIW
jgi:phosphatidylglycerophosphate synthase